MDTITDGDLTMMATFVLAMVVDSLVIWSLQAYQDTIGKYKLAMYYLIYYTPL
jgi:hypothetical protein